MAFLLLNLLDKSSVKLNLEAWDYRVTKYHAKESEAES